MSVKNLRDNIYWIGVNNPELRVFDIIMSTEKGTTYNSYLIDDEKICIIDTVKDGYFEEFERNIKSVIGDKKVDYIVVQHTELDHSGSLIRLIEKYPEAVVIGSKAALIYCRDILNRNFNSMEAKDNLNIGKTTLKFISAPNLHWPDTIFTLIEDKKILFTCDVFGAHYSYGNNITEEHNNEQYNKEMKYYFDVIMGPFKKFVIMALNKVSNFDIDIVAPSHGPVHLNNYKNLVNLYKKWAEEQEIKEKNVEIFYISAYSNTEKIAYYINEKLNSMSVKADVHEITSMDISDIISLIEKSKGVLIGSPTINQDAVKPAWDVLSLVCPITNRGKAAAAFGSYGWSGEGVLMLTERLKALKFKTVEGGLRFKFVPSEEDYKKTDEFIEKFIALL